MHNRKTTWFYDRKKMLYNPYSLVSDHSRFCKNAVSKAAFITWLTFTLQMSLWKQWNIYFRKPKKVKSDVSKHNTQFHQLCIANINENEWVGDRLCRCLIKCSWLPYCETQKQHLLLSNHLVIHVFLGTDPFLVSFL